MNFAEQIGLVRNYLNERIYPEDKNEVAAFWKRDDIVAYLNAAQTHYNAFINNLDESFSVNEVDFPSTQIVNNTITLPNDLQKVKYVEAFDNSQQSLGIEVRPSEITERNRLSTNQYFQINFRYYLQGNKIKIFPDVKSAQFIKLFYLMRQKNLQNNEDICQLPEECHENMVMYSVIRGLLRDKQKTLAEGWILRLKEKDDQLTNFLQPRQIQEPATVLPRADWELGYGYGIGL